MSIYSTCMNFIVIDNNGQKVSCDVIGVFKHNDKDFIVYSDNTKEVYASLYKMDGDNVVLLPITDENDWNIVDKYLENL